MPVRPDPDVALVAMTTTCKIPVVPSLNAKFTVAVWSPADSPERFAVIEIEALPGNNCPLAGDTLSQPIPFVVNTVEE